MRRLSVAAAIAVFVFAALYRFNTLGGALGGFDDDHFVHLAYALQVADGEQPLRDFEGVGLQGARPPLTYELSAWAQRLLGRGFRAEALLTVSATALAAAITWLAAVRLAPPLIAAAATLLSIFVAPKLYNYPKVLLFAAAAWLIVRYAARPTRAAVVLFSLLTAAAFLFRHDYAVYVGAGLATVLLTAGATMAGAFKQLALYGVLTLAFLTPSLLVVQRDAGIAHYLRDSTLAAQHEASRTNLEWPTVSWEVTEESAEAWLYYLHLALPVLLVLMLLRLRHKGETPPAAPALVALAVMAQPMHTFLLRGNLAARFGDMAPVFAVLLAGTAGLACARWGDRDRLRLVRGAAASLVVTGAAAAIWLLGSVRSELDASGWSDSLDKIESQATRRWQELATMPGSLLDAPDPGPSVRAARYLRECTAPDDRLIIFSYQPELLVFADRRFGGGRGSFIPELFDDEWHQQQALAVWKRQQVPIVLSEAGDDDNEGYAAEFSVLRAYLQSQYRPAGELELEEGVVLRVFVRAASASAATDVVTGLPCPHPGGAATS